MKLKYKLRIEYGLFAAAGISAALPILLLKNCDWLLPVGGILAVLGVLWQIFMVRCPHCGDTIGYPADHPEFCAKCGQKLDWE